jgi:hypothetical protein
VSPVCKDSEQRSQAFHAGVLKEKEKRWVPLALLPAHGRCAHEAPPDFVDLCTLACAPFLLLPWFPTNTIQNHEEDFEIPAAAERRIIRRRYTRDDEAFHTHTQFAPFLVFHTITSETPTLLSFEYGSIASIGRPQCPIRDHERNRRRSSLCLRKQALGHQPKWFAVTQWSVHNRSA